MLSSEEVYKDFASTTNAKYDTALGTSKQLDYYKNQGVSTKNYSGVIKQYNGSNNYWWHRSAYSRYANSIFAAGRYGAWGDSLADSSFGVSPAFRL